MKIDIIAQTQANVDYRKVIATGADSQLVLMNLQPGDDVGDEVYGEVDQITVVVDGTGRLEMSGDNGPIEVGDCVFAPAGVRHNIINDSEGELKLYTIYAPPEYEPGSVQTAEESDSEDDIDVYSDNFDE